MAEGKVARLSGYYGELKKFIENSHNNKVIKVANKSKQRVTQGGQLGRGGVSHFPYRWSAGLPYQTIFLYIFFTCS